MFFDDEADLLKYTSNEDYEYDDDRPGICFGFSLTKSDNDNYAVSYHWDD